MKKIVLVLTVIASMNMQAQNKELVPPSVSVTGEGIVKVVPDEVLIRVRIENEGNSAEEVKRKNDEGINSVFKFLKSLKLDDEHVKTEYVNLSKNYDYQTKEYKYVANQSVSILLKDLDKYEKLSQGLIEAGINRIDGVEFRSTEIEKHKAEARIKAMMNAKEKAEAYAKVLGQNIGKAIYISEGNAHVPPMPVFKTMAMVESDSAGGNSQTIAKGQIEIKTDVNVVFELK